MVGQRFKVGERVIVGKDRGTIRYIGKINGYESDWIGIDWDDEERGKNNGMVNGQFYFNARLILLAV